MNIYRIALCLLMSSSSIYSEDIKDLEFNRSYTIPLETEESNLSITIIVPCHHAHAKFLYQLLRRLECQSILPNEVVISLSEFREVPSYIMQQLEQAVWAFPVTLILSERKQHPGQNRNIASSKAVGDILIYHDADDESDPDRNKIIIYLFNKYNLDQLMHSFVLLHQEEEVAFPHYESIRILRPSDYDTQVPAKDIHNGNIAISRKLFSTFKWPDYKIGDGEDETYNKIIYKHYDNRMIVQEPLIVYRNYLSSCNEISRFNLVAPSESENNVTRTHHITFLYNSL